MTSLRMYLILHSAVSSLFLRDNYKALYNYYDYNDDDDDNHLVRIRYHTSDMGYNSMV